MPLCALRTASANDKGVCMTESLLGVINFDKHIARQLTPIPAANDAYYVAVDGEPFFMEFKTGRIREEDIEAKMQGSMRVCVELGIMPDADAVRSGVHYILVYNSGKYGDDSREAKEARAVDDVYGTVTRDSSRRTLDLFHVGTFEGRYCRMAECMSETEFYRLFVCPMEESDPCRVP